MTADVIKVVILAQICLLFQVNCWSVAQTCPNSIDYFLPPRPLLWNFAGPPRGLVVPAGVNPMRSYCNAGKLIYKRLNASPSPFPKRKIYITEQALGCNPKPNQNVCQTRPCAPKDKACKGRPRKISKRDLIRPKPIHQKPVKLPPVKHHHKKTKPEEDDCDCTPDYFYSQGNKL